jgi:gliding motility-associated-like protein
MYGCKAEKKDAVIIHDMFNVYVPNTFTPDDDGINEVFLPAISGKSFIHKYVFRIYDRWGTTLFETNDYDEPWKGDVRGGEYYAKDEVYNWQIIIQLKGSDEERAYQGHVFLLR